ncbi:unnamed protein product [Rotaria sp. Silwood1]|nr:unnamed protein product [Rotaria sp. Silwood1]
MGSKGHRQVRVPINTTILIVPYTLHRRADFWSRPLEFDYIRWLRNPITDLKPNLPHPYCYLSFSVGQRNCIEQHFALLAAKVILLMLIQQCNFELEPDQSMVADFIITMRPKHDLRVLITKRA